MPPTCANFHITDRGSDWYLSAFCVFTLFVLVFCCLMSRKPVNERIFYYTSICPTGGMAIAYSTMASDLGWNSIKVDFNHITTSTQEEHPGFRHIVYARYFGWFLAFPWPAVQASLMGNTPNWQKRFNVSLTGIFTSGLSIASVVHSTNKCGYFVFGITSAIICLISILTTTKNLIKENKKTVWTFFYLYCGVF